MRTWTKTCAVTCIGIGCSSSVGRALHRKSKTQSTCQTAAHAANYPSLQQFMHDSVAEKNNIIEWEEIMPSSWSERELCVSFISSSYVLPIGNLESRDHQYVCMMRHRNIDFAFV